MKKDKRKKYLFTKKLIIQRALCKRRGEFGKIGFFERMCQIVVDKSRNIWYSKYIKIIKNSGDGK